MTRLSLWQFIQKQLADGQNVMLLTVAASEGSSPGRPGFKMAAAAFRKNICNTYIPPPASRSKAGRPQKSR